MAAPLPLGHHTSYRTQQAPSPRCTLGASDSSQVATGPAKVMHIYLARCSDYNKGLPRGCTIIMMVVQSSFSQLPRGMLTLLGGAYLPKASHFRVPLQGWRPHCKAVLSRHSTLIDRHTSINRWGISGPWPVRPHL